MIKDIGIEGLNKNISEHSKRVTARVIAMGIDAEMLRVMAAAPKNDIYDFYSGRSAIVASEAISLDMVDVTTMDDTERVYMQCFSEITGPR